VERNNTIENQRTLNCAVKWTEAWDNRNQATAPGSPVRDEQQGKVQHAELAEATEIRPRHHALLCVMNNKERFSTLSLQQNRLSPWNRDEGKKN
jgi:hypothetical protein